MTRQLRPWIKKNTTSLLQLAVIGYPNDKQHQSTGGPIKPVMEEILFSNFTFTDSNFRSIQIHSGLQHFELCQELIPNCSSKSSPSAIDVDSEWNCMNLTLSLLSKKKETKHIVQLIDLSFPIRSKQIPMGGTSSDMRQVLGHFSLLKFSNKRTLWVFRLQNI